MGIVSKARSLITREKNLPASGGYPLPVTGGWIPAGWSWNWWQQGKNPMGGGESSTVHACVDAYSQTIASLPGNHFRKRDDGGNDVLSNTPLTNFLRYPNSYQTKSDYMLNLIKQLMFTGNSYSLAMRDDRGDIVESHLMDSRSTEPMFERESQTIYYAVGSNPIIGEVDYLVPQRDMMHIRLYTPRHPLIGVSPIINLASSISANQAIMNHQSVFFNNMSRPSGILATDQVMNRDQMMMLREAWEAQSQGLNSGRVPILSNGLKWQSLSITSQDSQVVDAYRMGVEEIARAFRVPLPLIGDNRNNTYNNVEQLVSSWLAMGLGFVLEHVESSINRYFDLPEDEFVNYDADALMRTDFEGRINALAKAVTNGIYSPNEARRREGLRAVKFGDEPRVQAQNVPLSAVGKIPETAQTPDSAPTSGDEEIVEDEEEVEEEDEKIFNLARDKYAVLQLIEDKTNEKVAVNE